MSAPGWYQNPEGPGHRYWDGQRWAPPQPGPPPTDPPPGASSATPLPEVNQPGQAASSKKSPRNFVFIALGSLGVAILAFVAMQLAFSAAAEKSNALPLQVAGFVFFSVWIVSVFGVILGSMLALYRLISK